MLNPFCEPLEGSEQRCGPIFSMLPRAAVVVGVLRAGGERSVVPAPKGTVALQLAPMPWPSCLLWTVFILSQVTGPGGTPCLVS